jgi:hypothetical protein
MLAKPINAMRVGLDNRNETERGCHVRRQRAHRFRINDSATGSQRGPGHTASN